MQKKIDKKTANKKVDGLESALTNILSCLEEIPVSDQKGVADFLFPQNIQLIKKYINDYKEVPVLILQQDRALFNCGIEIKKRPRKDWTLAETKKMAGIAEIIVRRAGRRFLIDLLNDAKNNPFIQLLDEKNEDQIETIHRQWVERSYYAEIPSAHLTLVAQLLKNMEIYFRMIIDNKELKTLIKIYDIKTDILTLAKKAMSLIKYEEETLCRSMLARLTLAKLRVPDDILLTTFTSLLPLGLSQDFFNKQKNFFTHQLLSSELSTTFYNYIVSSNNPFMLTWLNEIYTITPAEKTKSMPSYVLAEMPGFKYIEKPWPHMPTDFSAAKLTGSVFLCANFRSSLLVSTDVQSCDFRDVYFENANAQFANFTGADGRGAQLHWIYAKSATFTCSDFSEASFHGAYLCKANFQKCRLEKTDFRLAKLHKANFFGFTGSCNFNGADLSNANMLGIDIAKNTYIGANLIGAQFIKDETEKDILSLLDRLEQQLKNREYEMELIDALEQNIIDKLESVKDIKTKDVRKSPLLNHTLFKEHRVKTSPLATNNTLIDQFFALNNQLPELSMKDFTNIFSFK